MSNYKDVEKKITYHKKRILQEFINKGIFPDNAVIENRLKSIDSHLAIFQNYNVSTGTFINADEYNQRLNTIYTDLTFLYELIYELTVLEFNKLQSFVNSHLSELNSIVETYNKRAEYENSSTTLGKTLLFKNNSFSIEDKDSITKVNLGELSIPDASTLACIANINNVKAEDVIFKLTNESSGAEIVCSAYNYNNDILIMPGDVKKNKYEHSLQDNQKINGPLLLDVIPEVNIKNKYKILGGKNNIFVNYKDEDGYIVEEKPLTIDSLLINKKAYINFYVVEGNSITFKFNKKPIATNFPIDTQRIDSLKPIHHFFIECDENFMFEFEIDKGYVYATLNDGTIYEDKLYYIGSDKIRDFLIIESSAGDLKNYNVTMEAHNSNENIDIDSIIIKQMEGF